MESLKGISKEDFKELEAYIPTTQVVVNLEKPIPTSKNFQLR